MRRTFSASLEQLYSMLTFIRERAIATGFDPVAIAKVELACEEALVNIINYAYPDHQGSIDILCKPSDPAGLTICMRDQGIPYDPLTQGIQAEPHELGGYGLPLILNIMDKVQYAREEQDNVLILVKYLAPAARTHG